MNVNCDYCDKPAHFVGGDTIYPHRPDLAHKQFWLCNPCDAYVGTHANTGGKPLGRLANKELREAKKAAHAAFDPLWQAKMAREKCSKSKARGKGYQWLAKKLGIAPKDCHIGMFDVEMCKRVVEIVRAA